MKFSNFIIEKECRKGTVVAKQGDNATGIYLINDGTFEKHIKDEDGTIIRVSVVTKDAFYGLEEVMLKEEKFKTTLICTSYIGSAFFMPGKEVNNYCRTKSSIEFAEKLLFSQASLI